MPPPLHIYAAMDMALPCLSSQESNRQEDEWLEVPNSREWRQS